MVGVCERGQFGREGQAKPEIGPTLLVNDVVVEEAGQDEWQLRDGVEIHRVLPQSNAEPDSPQHRCC